MVQEWCVEDYYENNEPDAENRYPSTLRGSYQLTTVNTLANILYTTEIQDNQSGQSKTILSSCLVDMVGGQRYRLEDLFYRGWKQTLRQQVEQIYRSQLPAGQEVPAALEAVSYTHLPPG